MVRSDIRKGLTGFRGVYHRAGPKAGPGGSIRATDSIFLSLQLNSSSERQHVPFFRTFARAEIRGSSRRFENPT